MLGKSGGVVVSDREPYEGADGLWYFDDRRGVELYAHALPDQIFAAIGGELAEGLPSGYQSRGFPTHELAHAALNRAVHEHCLETVEVSR